MNVLKTRNGKGINFTGSCNEVVGIDTVVEHRANKKWRADSEKSVAEEREDLMQSIKTQGLREPITMYDNSKIIISGHTRTEILRQLGAIEVPVTRLLRTEKMRVMPDGEIDPMDPEVIREHAISNTRVNTTVQGRYNYAREIMSAWVENFDPEERAQGQISTKLKLEILKIAGTGHASFDVIENVRFGYLKEVKGKEYFVEPRPDLYDDLGNPDKDFTARQLGKIQWTDFRAANFTDFFAQQDFMDDTLENLKFKNVIQAVSDNLASIAQAAETSVYPGVNWFNDTDDNYVSATTHHMICAFTCVELNKLFDELGFEATAKQGKAQSHYDIMIQDRDGNDVSSIEVKTTFGKTNWASGSNKTGYALLFAYNKERDRFFASSTYLEMGDWKGGYTLSAQTVHDKENVNYYTGDIELDNDTYRIQKYKL
jgi:hypothetical protein